MEVAMSIARFVSLFRLVGLGLAAAWQPAPSPAPSAETADLLSQLPLYFIQNQGQIGRNIRYYVQGRDRTLYFTPDGAIFRLAGAPGPNRTFNGSRDAFVVAIGSGLTGRSLYLPLILR
jgi:hypothetical protein